MNVAVKFVVLLVASTGMNPLSVEISATYCVPDAFPFAVQFPVIWLALTPLTDGEIDAIDDNEIFAAFDEADANIITAEDLGEVDLQLNDDELLAYLENEDADITDLITDIE